MGNSIALELNTSPEKIVGKVIKGKLERICTLKNTATILYTLQSINGLQQSQVFQSYRFYYIKLISFTKLCFKAY